MKADPNLSPYICAFTRNLKRGGKEWALIFSLWLNALYFDESLALNKREKQIAKACFVWLFLRLVDLYFNLFEQLCGHRETEFIPDEIAHNTNQSGLVWTERDRNIRGKIGLRFREITYKLYVVQQCVTILSQL